MDNWDEIRTAYQVARKGTVSGAADSLGVHHATVIRHIDALEQRLGVKLFQRHARGYTATEAGQDLLQVAQATDDQFTQLAGRIKGQGEGVSGDLVVTSLEMMSDILTPILIGFQTSHPEVRVRFRTGDRVFRLEYGEAHVAIRAGRMPDEPDNVVQPFVTQGMVLVAAEPYIAKYGLPEDIAAFKDHYFVGPDDEKSRAPFAKWMRENVPTNRIVYLASENRHMRDAVLAGAGIGFVQRHLLQRDIGLTEVIPPSNEWETKLWLVTHVDLHRTAKVQAFLTYLKNEIKGLSDA
ncbi:LysR family transcriptional regulator [Loktanella sp. D2R18]|uniref:LysR family transcriptional regulator n=1 Tax=Rhodobacterales TaxID=204455 RepID=UPI000DEBAEF4|nr:MULTISPECIES: LysR family transcriptional regulator [Rhodobacterales]MDO6588789.1 LysR family transcriptional regulator [Yoonia sp. 1_MG-2023]RBW41980.1 LysR family transcriptional regulator [Loktanella sp. D2R18]